MGVKFVIGPARSGKTTATLRRIAEACKAQPFGSPILLLVPEQGAFEAERALLSQGRDQRDTRDPGDASGSLAGYTRAQVLGFTRLVDFILAETPADRVAPLTAGHRLVLARLAVARLRQDEALAPFLPPGIEEDIEVFLQEIHQCRLSRASFDAAESRLRAQGLPSESAEFLKRKADATFRIIEEMDRIVGGRFTDPADQMASLADRVAKSERLRGVTIHVDGFNGFTPVEESLLGALAARAREVTINLLGQRSRAETILAGKRVGQNPVLSYVEDTLRRLMRVFEVRSVAVNDVAFLGEEVHLLPEPDTGIDVRFVEAADRRVEARAAAEQCARWIREEGFAPSSVGILARDVEEYAGVMKESFAALRLPLFLDRSEPVRNHPFVAGVQELIQAVTGPWDPNCLIRLLKSGLLAVPRRDADRLAQHHAHHPRSRSEWFSTNPWKPPRTRLAFEDGDGLEEKFDERIDLARRGAAEVVNALRTELGLPGKMEGRFETFLRAVSATLATIVAAKGPPSLEDAAILKQVGACLGEAWEACGEEPVAWPVAGEIVIRSFASLTVPRIPPVLDQVFVGQMDRSRQPSLRAVILLGFSEAQFPPVSRGDGILSDGERRMLRDAGLDLRPDSAMLYEREHLFAYRAFHAAAERLVISRPLAASGSTVTPPSMFWTEAREAFPSASVSVLESTLDLAHAARPRELAVATLRELDHTHLVRPVARLRSSDFLGRDTETRTIVESAQWRNEARLSKELVAEAMGEKLRVNATRLQALAACPFKHYVRYFLRPDIESHPKLDARDLGDYSHAILATAMSELREGGTVNAEEIADSVREAILQRRDLLEGSAIAQTATGSYMLQRIEDEITDISGFLAHQYGILGSKPRSEEHKLRVMLPAPFPVELSAIIDRVDTRTASDGDWVFITDYKLRGKLFNFASWLSGEDIQLPVYLLTVMKSSPEGVRPGGAFFLEIEEDQKAGTGSRRMQGIATSSALTGIATDSLKEVVRSTKTGPILTDEIFAALLRETETRVLKSVAEIASGNCSISPSRKGNKSACTYCDLRPICQFDPRTDHYRDIPMMSAQDVIQKLAGGGDS